MNECKRGRPSRPLHRDLLVYCASPFSIVPSATQRFGWSIDPSDVILNKLKPHIHAGHVWLFCSSPTTHLPRAGFEPLVHPCLLLRFQQQVRWMQPGTLMVHQSFLALAAHRQNRAGVTSFHYVISLPAHLHCRTLSLRYNLISSEVGLVEIMATGAWSRNIGCWRFPTSDKLRSESLWWWYINTNIIFLEIQNPVSETLFLNKSRTMDNVQKHNICVQ
jgi:hypothetical protein